MTVASRRDSWTRVEAQAVEATLTALRAQIRERGPNALGRVVASHLMSGSISPLHEALNAWHVAEADRDPGAMDAYAAPRGHGKSTAGVEIAALWHAANLTRRYIVIASDTYSQAVQRIETISTEILTNDKLRALYPDLRPDYDALGHVVAWRDDELALANGVRIVGVGAGKAIRGAKKGEHRPDLLLLDDLEDETSVATEAAREKRLRWLLRVALALGDNRRPVSALWVGTILSRSSLLNQATGAALDDGQTRPEWSRGWTPHVYRAELDDTPRVETRPRDPQTGEPAVDAEGKPLTYLVGEPLWSELTREDLATIRLRVGALSYAAEYLSDPADEATALLAPPRPVSYVNPNAPPMARIIRARNGSLVPVANLTRAAALDPQYATETGRNDPDLAAVVVAGQHGPDTYLLDAWIGRDRHGQAARLVDLAIRWSCYAAGVEAVAAQAVTADAAAADGRVPIIPMTRGEDKVARALPLGVRLGERDRPETCRVSYLPDAEPVVEYLERFPHGRYDDPVDATVDAVTLAARAAGRGGGGLPQGGGHRAP